jgi:hypothetical protein
MQAPRVTRASRECVFFAMSRVLGLLSGRDFLQHNLLAKKAGSHVKVEDYHCRTASTGHAVSVVLTISMCLPQLQSLQGQCAILGSRGALPALALKFAFPLSILPTQCPSLIVVVTTLRCSAPLGSLFAISHCLLLNRPLTSYIHKHLNSLSPF